MVSPPFIKKWLAKLCLIQTASNRAFSVSAIGIIPVAERFSFWGKVGVDAWEVEHEYKTTFGLVSDPSTIEMYGDSDTYDGTDLFFSVGCSLFVGDSFSVDLGYEVRTWEDSSEGADIEFDTKNVNLGMSYYF